MARSKMFKSMADAESAYRYADKLSTLRGIALDDLVAKKIEWYPTSATEIRRPLEIARVGFTRLDAPHGGLMILLHRSDSGRFRNDGRFERPTTVIVEYLDEAAERFRPDCLATRASAYIIEAIAWAKRRRYEVNKVPEPEPKEEPATK